MYLVLFSSAAARGPLSEHPRRPPACSTRHPTDLAPRPAVRYKMLSCLFEYNAEQTAPAAPAISPGQHRARGLGAGGASRSADNLKEPRPPFLCRKDSGYCIQPQTLSNSFH